MPQHSGPSFPIPDTEAEAAGRRWARSWGKRPCRGVAWWDWYGSARPRGPHQLPMPLFLMLESRGEISATYATTDAAFEDLGRAILQLRRILTDRETASVEQFW